MAEVINYVDTDVVGGAGDGSTWANAYATLSACEDAEDGNWDAANNWLHIYCAASSGTADTTAVNVNGSTLSDTEYILIEATTSDKNGATHRATASGWKTDRYRLEVTDPSSAAIYIQDTYVRVDGLQVRVIYSAAANKYNFRYTDIAASNDLRITNCRILGTTVAAANNIALVTGDSDINLKMWNCIIYNFDEDGLFLSAQTTVSIYNCVIYGCGADAVEIDTGTAVIKNCVSFNNADDFQDDTAAATIDYCASDDNDGTNNVAESGGGAAWPNDFTDAANGNFTLVSGSNLIGAGVVDPGSGLFSNDIENTTRGAAWDLGAFEYVSAAAGTSIPQMMAYYRRLRT